MAQDLGKRLLDEVGGEVGFDEILNTLRLQDQSDGPKDDFNFPPLDRFLLALVEAKGRKEIAPPILELTSLAPGGGKTHLLYHLCARATLPRHLGGKQACVVIIDTDGKFSVPRLAAQVRLLLPEGTREGAQAQAAILEALKHVHIFRPQSLASTIATLDALPHYLFNASKHYSFDRQVSFIALDSASAFYWQDRAESEDAAFLAATSDTKPTSHLQPSNHAHLSASLKAATKTLHCPAIITSNHTFPIQSGSAQGPQSRSIRPALPAPFSTLPTLRLIVQRLPVRKFPPGISVEEALREAGDRLKAVEEGKCECWVNEWGLEEKVIRRLSEDGRGGFGFRVSAVGVTVEQAR